MGVRDVGTGVGVEDGQRPGRRGRGPGGTRLVFVFQNTASRQVHFLFWTVSMPSWIWLLIIFLAGAVVGSMFPWLRKKRG